MFCVPDIVRICQTINPEHQSVFDSVPVEHKIPENLIPVEIRCAGRGIHIHIGCVLFAEAGIGELAEEGDTFIGPGPGDVRQCEADPGHFQHTFKVAGPVEIRADFAAVPQDPGVEQNRHIQLRHFPVCVQPVCGHIPVAEDFESFDSGIFSVFHLLNGICLRGVDPVERIIILQF